MNDSAPTRRGGELIFPREMTGEELREARQHASRAGIDAQAVLDVLIAAIQAWDIRNPSGDAGWTDPALRI